MTIAATDADEAAILLQATLAEVDDQEHDELMRLAREARQQGWRQHHGDLGITP